MIIGESNMDKLDEELKAIELAAKAAKLQKGY